MPHRHLGFRDIIKQCSPWPSWTKYSSVLIFQNHTALDLVVNFGSARASLSGRDRLAGSADMWIIATPFLDTLEVDLRFSLASIPTAEACWISDCLTLVLKAMTKSLSTTLRSVKATLSDAYPSHTLPLGAPVIAPSVSYNQFHLPSPSSVGLVWRAWRELSLLVAEDKGEDGQSIFDRGADMVTMLLLAQCYNVTIKVLLAYPSRTLQAHLLDLEAPAARCTT
ncbi:uncharacterized protein BDZ99DRAFT_166753 [Mytilinidion resinicola]|uniref:Uncharacterized protein n=1 Tax=Mytilinidion resinicola TaxID=574789 RepID=A0A6A6Y3Y9_9PEZI|nr:uncharacterized protein BDZ99DRAFT_166753 [Mytilinidion resinicola]KAF2803551.1 hypothetical protein BDZ99DRAFT_166753 [Mytilinidion resinicola]